MPLYPWNRTMRAIKICCSLPSVFFFLKKKRACSFCVSWELRCVLSQSSTATAPPRRRRRSSTSSWAPSHPAFCSTGSRSRSEEHTSELQSQSNLVCRLLLEKKKKNKKRPSTPECRAHI